MRHLSKNMLYAIIKSIVIPLAAALVMAFVWDLLDWMQNYGSGLPLIPQLTNLPEHMRAPGGSDSYSISERFIDWYNFTFLGAARFGTALGIILGGIYVICSFEQRPIGEKYVAAAIIGLMMGGRIGLLISSSSHIFVGGLVIGLMVAVVGVFAFRHADDTPDLPIARFVKQ